MAAPVAVPAPAPQARSVGGPIFPAPDVINGPGSTQATGLVLPGIFPPSERTTPEKTVPAKRVSWHSSLGRLRGYGIAPPTRVGFSNPTSDCASLFEKMQSEYDAIRSAKRWARAIARHKPGKSQNSNNSDGCGADADGSRTACVQFRRSLGLSPNDSLDFPDLRPALKHRASLAPCVTI